eukprot:386926-Pleurochrysis_carterae.AAC.1
MRLRHSRGRGSRGCSRWLAWLQQMARVAAADGATLRRQRRMHAVVHDARMGVSAATACALTRLTVSLVLALPCSLPSLSISPSLRLIR